MDAVDLLRLVTCHIS